MMIYDVTMNKPWDFGKPMGFSYVKIILDSVEGTGHPRLSCLFQESAQFLGRALANSDRVKFILKKQHIIYIYIYIYIDIYICTCMYICIWCTIRNVLYYTYHYVYTILINILYDYHWVCIRAQPASISHWAAPAHLRPFSSSLSRVSIDTRLVAGLLFQTANQWRMHSGLLQLTQIEDKD
jgi:hypothetical protein